jgi:LmbE family N-acetylglucosaminyl deacetylase
VPPEWTSVLAVIAHPDDALFGLGAILDAFVFAGVRVEVLCLTHGQAWMLEGAPGDLAALRGAELASAADVLGPTRAEMADCPDGALGEVGQARLVDEVIASADSCFPDGLLVFDTDAVEGHFDQVTSTSAGMKAAEILALPVLGWALSEAVAAQLNHEFGNRFTSSQDKDVDLRVTVNAPSSAWPVTHFRTRRCPAVHGGVGWSCSPTLKAFAGCDRLAARWVTERAGPRRVDSAYGRLFAR